MVDDSAVRPNTTVLALWRILDRLDNENDDNVRADLIDQAIELADMDEDAATEWKGYR